MRRGPIAIALSGLVVLASCGGGDRSAGGRPVGDPTADDRDFSLAVDETVAPWEPSDEYEALAAKVDPDGRLMLGAALSMFALQYGPLPEVAVPTGDPGPSRPGDLAVASVLARWSELTPPQQDGVRAALDLEPGWAPTGGAAAPGTPGSPADAPPATDTSAADKAAEDKAAKDATTGGGRSAAVRRDALAAYRASLAPLVEVFERHLGPLGATVDIETSSDVIRGPRGEQALAESLLVTSDRCRIRVFPAVFSAPSRPHHTLAHELFHCYQQRWNGGPLRPALGWVQEGTAEWTAAVATEEAGGPADSDLRNWLAEYYETPSRALFSRTYDAVGWFGYVAERTGPLWDRLPAIVNAGTSTAAYAAAVGAASGPGLTAEWASSQGGRSSMGRRWFVDGPGMPEMNNPAPPGFPILRNGAAFPFVADAYATAQGSASLEANLTKFNAIPPTDGYVNIGGRDRPLAELTGTTWCTDPEGRCTCPPGTARAGQSFPRLDGTEALLAVGGGTEAGSLTVQGTSLEDECGTQGVCPIGKFQMNALPTGLPYVVESGGTGTIVTVDETGLVTMDFSEFVPMWAHDDDDTALRTYIAPSGFVTGRIDVPTGTERLVDEPVRDPDGSGIGGTGRTELDGQVVLEFTGADMQAVALAGGNFGDTLMSCLDDDTLTVSGGGIVQTYARVS